MSVCCVRRVGWLKRCTSMCSPGRTVLLLREMVVVVAGARVSFRDFAVRARKSSWLGAAFGSFGRRRQPKVPRLTSQCGQGRRRSLLRTELFYLGPYPLNGRRNTGGAQSGATSGERLFDFEVDREFLA